MILCRNERRGFAPRRNVAKVMRNQEEADAKNLKPPRVVPLRLCFLAVRPELMAEGGATLGGEERLEIPSTLSSEA